MFDDEFGVEIKSDVNDVWDSSSRLRAYIVRRHIRHYCSGIQSREQ